MSDARKDAQRLTERIRRAMAKIAPLVETGEVYELLWLQLEKDLEEAEAAQRRSSDARARARAFLSTHAV